MMFISKKFSWSIGIIVLAIFISTFAFRSVYSTAKPTVNTEKAVTRETSATLKGMIKDQGGKEITRYGFKWGTSKKLNKTESFTRTAQVEKPFSMTISRLKAGNTYYYQAYAVNSKGASYGSIKSFTLPVQHNISSTVSNTNPEDKSDVTQAAVKLAATSADDKKVNSQPVVNQTNHESKPVSRGTSYTYNSKYPRLSKANGSFGQFRYRDIGGGRIEVDPNWVAQNIVTIKLPGLNRYVQVHKNARDNFITAFNYIKNGTAVINGKQVPLLSLINTMDGTYVTRHVNWNPAQGLSNHSWGTAIDINASNHFRYVNPGSEPFDPNLILWEKAFKPAGFSWGNSYSDSMHFELIR